MSHLRHADSGTTRGLRAGRALPVAVILLLLAGSPAGAQAQAPQGTKEEARAMVEKAVRWFEQRGRTETLAEISRAGTEKAGAFIDRDLYIFAYDFRGVVLAHGANPRLIGRNLADFQDADGRYLIRGLMDTALKGGGWYYYKWANPITKKIEDKMAYVLKVADDLWIGCGVYGKQVRERAQVRIGVFNFFASKWHDDALRGIRDRLAEEGLTEPRVRFTVEEASGSYLKAEEQVRRLADAHLDLVFTLGTSATVAVTREIDVVPVVFSGVYDPVASRIARSWESSGNNTTGTSTKVPMVTLLERLQELKPAKRLAVLYSPGQTNSETQLKELQGAQANKKIRVVPVPLTRETEVAQVLPEVIHTTDAIYLTGSSVVEATLPLIVEAANREGIPTVTHLRSLVERGALLGLCVTPYRAGRLAGQKAIQILSGTRPSSIPIEAPDGFELVLNRRTAAAGRFRIPSVLVATAHRVDEVRASPPVTAPRSSGH